MYRTSHFHYTAHELLCIASGHATPYVEHENNPQRAVARVDVGDAIVVPVGVAHQRLEGFDDDFDFTMVGSYPKGQRTRRGYMPCMGKKSNGSERDRGVR